MFVRDIGAACTGFTAACGLQAIARFLSEPTTLIASLLILSGIAFAVALTFYATAIAKRAFPSRDTARPKRRTPSVRPA